MSTATTSEKFHHSAMKSFSRLIISQLTKEIPSSVWVEKYYLSNISQTRVINYRNIVRALIQKISRRWNFDWLKIFFWRKSELRVKFNFVWDENWKKKSFPIFDIFSEKKEMKKFDQKIKAFKNECARGGNFLFLQILKNYLLMKN
jgi:hypothetical protein